MSATLTTLISRTQAQLIDDGTRFTSATLTAAIRATLADINRRIPLAAADLIEAVTDQLEYEVNDIDTKALYVIDILRNDTDGDLHTPLNYEEFQEDTRVFFRLNTAEAEGEYILCKYARLHTVSGLDSETDSTLTSHQDQILVDGACAKALAIRAASRVETNNLQTNVSDNYREAMQAFESAYEAGVRFYQRRAGAPKTNRVSAWNDGYHGWPI